LRYIVRGYSCAAVFWGGKEEQVAGKTEENAAKKKKHKNGGMSKPSTKKLREIPINLRVGRDCGDLAGGGK